MLIIKYNDTLIFIAFIWKKYKLSIKQKILMKKQEKQVEYVDEFRKISTL